MGKEQNRIIEERIEEAVRAAEDKFFYRKNAIVSLVDIPRFGYYLFHQAAAYGEMMVKANTWRSNYPQTVPDITIKLIRKRMDYYREGLNGRDVTNDS